MQRKVVFDAVRQMLGRGFTRAEVERLDQALDQALERGDISSQDPVPCVPDLWIGAEGIQLIKRFEGCARRRPDGLVEAYPDPATGGAPWTIGWGATGADILPGTLWTQEQCDARLTEDLARYAGEVAAAIGAAPTTQS